MATPTKKKLVQKRPPTPMPSPVRKVKRCKEVPPKLFYSPIKKEGQDDSDTDEDPESSNDPKEDEEPMGRCIGCGALISAHAQLCGKTICLDPPPTPPREEPCEEEYEPYEYDPEYGDIAYGPLKMPSKCPEGPYNYEIEEQYSYPDWCDSYEEYLKFKERRELFEASQILVKETDK